MIRVSYKDVTSWLRVLTLVWLLSACGGESNREELVDNAAQQSPIASAPVGDVNTVIAPMDSSIIGAGIGETEAIEVTLVQTSGDIVDSENTQGMDTVILELGELTFQQLAFNVRFPRASQTTQCALNNIVMGRVDASNFQSQVKPAYLNEYYLLECIDLADYKLEQVREVVHLKSTKNDLASLFDRTLVFYRTLDSRTLYRDSSQNVANVPRRQRNYYYEINNLLTLSEIYSTPAAFGIELDDPILSNIENYLITTSEFYFQPCYDYDFYNDPPASCRSEFKQDGYYLWRSPLNNTERWRTRHAKIEWRSAAGVAQAVKAILLKHNNTSEQCLVNDLPTMVREQSVTCRAKNLRRLIAEQVWQKWQTEIEQTDVLHYVAWLELIVDMFNATVDIEHAYHCTENCYQPTVKASLLDRMLNFVTISDGYVNMTCRPSDERQQCDWREFKLGYAQSNDLSHLAIPIYVFEKLGVVEVCQGDSDRCFRRDALIRTLKEKTWTPAVDDAGAVNFPKFDMFLNGYCREHYADQNAKLQDYCQQYWITETGYNNSHREIFGFVNLGAYDAELLHILLQAADVNKDGVIDESDVLSRGYAAFLYRSAIQPIVL